MKVTFTEKDFRTLRNFEDVLKKKFGDTTYVGTDYATVLVEYSPELKASLRPFPPSLPLEYELGVLSCEDCKKNVVFFMVTNETTFVCGDCKSKRNKKKNK